MLIKADMSSLVFKSSLCLCLILVSNIITGYPENKLLTSFSKSENEVRSAVSAVAIFPNKFCNVDL